MLFRMILLAALAVGGLTAQEPSDGAKAALDEGVKLFKAAEYAAAVEAFRRARAQGHPSVDVLAYEGYAEMMQFIPGSKEPEHAVHADAAERLFLAALDQDSESLFTTKALASLYFNRKKFDEAKKMHQRVIELNPQESESYYTIGVICWTASYQPRLKARANLGMKPDDPGPIPDAAVRETLAAEIRPSIDEGLKALEEAIAINPDYADAMAYFNLLYRERADLAVDQTGYERDIAAADFWVEQTLKTKKRLAGDAVY